MAEIKFVIKDINESEEELTQIKSFELTKSADAACDGLRLTFIHETQLPQIIAVDVYNSKEKIFSGFADTQRQTESDSGFECFLYARSTACVLLDNEAQAYVFEKPTSHSLFCVYARNFGFTDNLPDVKSDTYYRVNKGTSCYGAINSLVAAEKGKNITVTPDNVLSVPDGNGQIDLDICGIISEKHIFNRANACLCIDYMADGDNGYSHHCKSRYFEKLKISKTKKMNLSYLPQWQAKQKLAGIMNSAAHSFECIETVIEGVYCPALYDRVSRQNSGICTYQDFFVNEIVITGGDFYQTKLLLSKDIDTQVIYYVA